MNKKIFRITEAAIMLALLVALQAVTKPLGQLVTGSCVNGVLALTVLLVGMSGGITVALISPVFAFLFGIAPNLVTVLPIMAGNVCFVVLLRLIAGKTLKPIWRKPVALAAAAGVKFAVLYLRCSQRCAAGQEAWLCGGAGTAYAEDAACYVCLASAYYGTDRRRGGADHLAAAEEGSAQINEKSRCVAHICSFFC